MADPKEYRLLSPDEHPNRALEQAARALCEARGINPDAHTAYDNGTMAYTLRPSWQKAADELLNFRLLMALARTLP